MASRYSVHTEDSDQFNSDSENIVISQNKRIFESILQEQQSRNELYTIDSSVITEQEQQHNTQQSSSTTTTEFVNSVLSNDVYDVETFINEMEGYPCLWNPSTRSHHDQHMRTKAWEELSIKFGKPGSYIFIYISYKFIVCVLLGFCGTVDSVCIPSSFFLPGSLFPRAKIRDN